MSPADTAPIRHAPIALWRVAAAFLQTLHALFGAPERVAFLHTLTGKQHALMASWLRAGEALMRRLLVIEASAYPKPNTRPLLHPRRSRTPKLMTFTPDAPHLWRVSFRCFHTNRGLSPSKAGATALRQAQGAPRKRLSREERFYAMDDKPLVFRSAWPLAERYEALLRVFNDPAPYARRLSKRLHATPHRLREPLRAPPEAPHRVDQFDQLRDCAERSWRPHFSSA